MVMRPVVREFAADVWSRRRGLALAQRAENGWTCSRYACAPVGEGPLALWWGRRAPSDDQLAALCGTASVVSVRAEVIRIPDACQGRLVLDGVDYAQGGAVELWRNGPSWRAVWTAEVRGDRPWSRWPDGEAAF
ncbi:hypothetical protein GVN24_31955 [Rhizobium sp. CRIBSB]|nr:hypothetical protein [Rhizobium sp. CRIBSB]